MRGGDRADFVLLLLPEACLLPGAGPMLGSRCVHAGLTLCMLGSPPLTLCRVGWALDRALAREQALGAEVEGLKRRLREALVRSVGRGRSRSPGWRRRSRSRSRSRERAAAVQSRPAAAAAAAAPAPVRQQQQQQAAAAAGRGPRPNPLTGSGAAPHQAMGWVINYLAKQAQQRGGDAGAAASGNPFLAIPFWVQHPRVVQWFEEYLTHDPR